MKLKHLRRLALEKITKQLNAGNILVELFSSFTSRFAVCSLVRACESFPGLQV